MIELTEEEKRFLLNVLTAGMELRGTYTQLVPVMNLIQGILQKLQAAAEPPVVLEAEIPT